MTITLTSRAGISATAEIVGTPECHRVTVTTGGDAINGNLLRVNFGTSLFGSDNIAVFLQQNSGFNLGQLQPQGEDSTGYEILVENCPAGLSTFTINAFVKEIIIPE
jgi:hypothetical protein